MSLCGEAFCKPMVGRATAIADIDGDGDLDLVITASGAASAIVAKRPIAWSSLAAIEARWRER